MRSVCPNCSRDFDSSQSLCPHDGARLLLVQPNRAAQLVGTDLDGRFSIDRLLGQGGMGAVYVGTQMSVGRDVAIKVIHPDQVADAETVKRFHREAQVISRLTHSHTVHLVDFGQTSQGLLYLVMELVKGRALSDDLSKGPLPPPRVAAIAGQICDALAEAHAQGIVHRDLKPDNILLTTQAGADDFVKILDFGIAKVAGIDERALSTLTEVGAIVGTPQYMSPEQIDASTAITGSSDLYSLTVMVFEMLAGRPPFRDASPMSLLIKHLKDEPPRLSEVAPALPVAAVVDDFLARNLSKRPEERSPDALSYKAELQRILAGAASVRPNRPVPQRPDRQLASDIKPTMAMQRGAAELLEGVAPAATVAYRPEVVAAVRGVEPVAESAVMPVEVLRPRSKKPAVAWLASGALLVLVVTVGVAWRLHGASPAVAAPEPAVLAPGAAAAAAVLPAAARPTPPPPAPTAVALAPVAPAAAVPPAPVAPDAPVALAEAATAALGGGEPATLRPASDRAPVKHPHAAQPTGGSQDFRLE